MRIIIDVRTDNAAFDGAGGPHEAARIIHEAADAIAALETLPTAPDLIAACRDYNGNTVGAVEFHDD